MPAGRSLQPDPLTPAQASRAPDHTQRIDLEHGPGQRLRVQLCGQQPRPCRVLVDKVVKRFGEDLSGRQFAVWGLSFVDNQTQALKGADALVIITEWKEFKSPDFDSIKALLKQPVVIDGRNLYEPAFMRTLGIEYTSIGRPG